MSEEKSEEKAMVFEEGKYYQHTSGHKLSILGRLPTTMWGSSTLIAEQDDATLLAVGDDVSSAVNYREITRDQWMESFS
jgi:hypothetical protein